MNRVASVRRVPLLITIDVHPREGLSDYISRTTDRLGELGIHATFFIPVYLLEESPDIIDTVLKNGHQIASHGLYHNNRESFRGFPPERYDLLSEKDQYRVIKEKTERFRKVLGRTPTCFRSPCFGISPATVRFLEEFDYRADFSVNSQRWDLLSSQPFTVNNLFAPRQPYHPSPLNPYREGRSNLWEIPLSAMIFPFAVMTLLTFGSAFAELFFRGLLQESKRTGKPIIYMCHPEEFNPAGSTYTLTIKELTLADFLPLRGEGIRARQAFRVSDPAKIFKKNIDFLKYMIREESLEILTADQYLANKSFQITSNQ